MQNLEEDISLVPLPRDAKTNTVPLYNTQKQVCSHQKLHKLAYFSLINVSEGELGRKKCEHPPNRRVYFYARSNSYKDDARLSRCQKTETFIADVSRSIVRLSSVTNVSFPVSVVYAAVLLNSPHLIRYDNWQIYEELCCSVNVSIAMNVEIILSILLRDLIIRIWSTLLFVWLIKRVHLLQIETTLSILRYIMIPHVFFYSV